MILILKKRNLKICLNGRKLLFGPASFLIIIIVLIVTDNNRQTNIITLSLFLLKKETKKPKLIKHNFYKIFFLNGLNIKSITDLSIYTVCIIFTFFSVHDDAFVKVHI